MEWQPAEVTSPQLAHPVSVVAAKAIPYVAVILLFPVIFYLTHSSLRYRFPMDPVMMVLAAYGVAYPIFQWRERTSPRAEAAAPAPPVPTT